MNVFSAYPLKATQGRVNTVSKICFKIELKSFSETFLSMESNYICDENWKHFNYILNIQ